MIYREDMLAQLETVMAKGQKRSNREIKKPKKTAADRAKTTAVASTAGAPAMATRDGKKKR